MVSSNTSDFTICHTSYKHRPKGKNVFLNNTSISYTTLEMVQLLDMFSWEKIKRKKAINKNYLKTTLKHC